MAMPYLQNGQTCSAGRICGCVGTNASPGSSRWLRLRASDGRLRRRAVGGCFNTRPSSQPRQVRQFSGQSGSSYSRRACATACRRGHDLQPVRRMGNRQWVSAAASSLAGCVGRTSLRGMRSRHISVATRRNSLRQQLSRDSLEARSPQELILHCRLGLR